MTTIFEGKHLTDELTGLVEAALAQHEALVQEYQATHREHTAAGRELDHLAEQMPTEREAAIARTMERGLSRSAAIDALGSDDDFHRLRMERARLQSAREGWEYQVLTLERRLDAALRRIDLAQLQARRAVEYEARLLGGPRS